MSLYLFGTCASYLLLIVDQLCAVFEWNKDTASVPILLASGCICLTMMVPRNITALQVTSGFGVCTNIYVALDILYEAISYIMKHGMVENPTMWNFNGSVFSAIATYAFSLQCHLIFIPVYWAMENRGIRKQNGVTAFAYTLCVLLYGTVGVLGYLAFGNAPCTDNMKCTGIQSDVLAYNLPRNAGSSIARICLALKSVVSYPLLHFPARLCLGDLVVGDDILKPQYWKQYYAMTLFFLVATMAIAYSVSNLGALIDLTSALLGVFQVFVWPGCVWISIRQRRRSPTFAVVVGILLITLGFSVTILGVTDVMRHEF